MHPGFARQVLRTPPRWPARSFVTTLLVAALIGISSVSSALADSTPTPSPSRSASPPAATASGAGNITFGIGPSTKKKVDRRSNFNTLTPRGTVVTDEVAVVNFTTAPLTLNLYAADALNGADGALALRPAAVAPVDAADRKSTRLNSSHPSISRMPSSA